MSMRVVFLGEAPPQKRPSSLSSISDPTSVCDSCDCDLEAVEIVSYDDMALDEDVYGFTIKSFIRDMFILEVNHHAGVSSFGRLARLSGSFLLLWVNILIQLVLIMATRYFVCAKAVRNIRLVYDEFEWNMYGEDESHMYKSADGFRRGKVEFFEPDNFANLANTLKDQACSIPLSRPTFLGLVLFIWTLTCIGELRRSYELWVALIWNSATSKTSFVAVRAEEEFECGVVKMRGLWRSAKVIVVVLVLIPRVVITCLLLWLGCRWLIATSSLESLILNGVALAFIKDIKDLVYTTLVSAACKRELELTRIKLAPHAKRERTDCFASFKALVWGFLAMAFVWAYIGIFQQVLVDYRWDVAGVCEDWVGAIHAFHIDI